MASSSPDTSFGLDIDLATLTPAELRIHLIRQQMQKEKDKLGTVYNHGIYKSADGALSREYKSDEFPPPVTITQSRTDEKNMIHRITLYSPSEWDRLFAAKSTANDRPITPSPPTLSNLKSTNPPSNLNF